MTLPQPTSSPSLTSIITRIFNAPRAAVWQAWTDPAQLVRWWGPKEFTAPVCKVDLRVGGKYHFCMRMPDGQELWTTGTYKEIVLHERIVCTDSFSDPEGNVIDPSLFGMPADTPSEFLMTITFEDHEGKTKMTLTHIGMPPGEMAEQSDIGWHQSFDKMEAIFSSK